MSIIWNIAYKQIHVLTLTTNPNIRIEEFLTAFERKKLILQTKANLM